MTRSRGQGEVGATGFGMLPHLRSIDKKSLHCVYVLDGFHIMARLRKAIDEVCTGSVRPLKAGGYEPVLKDGRWLLLKRRESLSEKLGVHFAELLQYNLKIVRALLLKEDFGATRFHALDALP